jgi:hypothetical protein
VTVRLLLQLLQCPLAMSLPVAQLPDDWLREAFDCLARPRQDLIEDDASVGLLCCCPSLCVLGLPEGDAFVPIDRGSGDVEFVLICRGQHPDQSGVVADGRHSATVRVSGRVQRVEWRENVMWLRDGVVLQAERRQFPAWMLSRKLVDAVQM